ncbi:glycosyltransferase family 2 protein [Pseudanabaena sp. UWO311]|jgi:glycosyltransferase involved in cell wall biosynthesis|uniref:glycosyltransferase family 2 protein n=1 Tax=Pseudanabaena sp. UWO311 TaxID=2487337 RepID=UPI00115BDE11|nr:glycosyltransferase family 2 protein [Pseudanabaena sp. UWO311]TYQ28123.1 glycosyltransferase family 2 protein [Pseudanabaena sp. UWO311]
MLEQITPLILTYNEVPNIGRTLERLTWAKRIVVIDSFSDDATLEILNSYPQVEVFQRQFDHFAEQCNYGLSQVQTGWVLSLDADYILSNELIEELHSLPDHLTKDAYFVKFKYCVFGIPLRGTLLPPRKVFYRKDKAIYLEDGHAHRVQVTGDYGYLAGYISHDDRKSLSRWLQSQDRYLLIEAQKLLATPKSELSFGDRLRKQKVIAPIVILLYCLILKGGILDGWAGWYYAWQRTLAEILLAIRLIELERHK